MSMLDIAIALKISKRNIHRVITDDKNLLQIYQDHKEKTRQQSNYTAEWTNELKAKIRERDQYTCFICKDHQKEITFHVHHINYIKEQCNPDNLITLCPPCHMKTNGNREYWANYFKELNR